MNETFASLFSLDTSSSLRSASYRASSSSHSAFFGALLPVAFRARRLLASSALAGFCFLCASFLCACFTGAASIPVVWHPSRDTCGLPLHFTAYLLCVGWGSQRGKRSSIWSQDFLHGLSFYRAYFRLLCSPFLYIHFSSQRMRPNHAIQPTALRRYVFDIQLS